MRRAVVAVGVGLVLAFVPGSVTLAQVQLDDPIEDSVTDTVDKVKDTVNDAGGAIKDTVSETAGEGRTGDVEEAANGGLAGASEAVASATNGAENVGDAVSDTILWHSGDGDGGGTALPSGVDRKESAAARGQHVRRTGHRNAAASRVTSHRSAIARQVVLASAASLAYVPLVVQLTNDADGDGTYTDLERAKAPGRVPFQVMLRNAGGRTLGMRGVREVSTIDSATRSVCSLTGRWLEPGESAQCRFNSATHVRPGERVVKVVEVDVVVLDDPGAAATVTDTSVVEGPSALGLFISRALASTGVMLGLLLLIAAALAAMGSLSSWAGAHRARIRRHAYPGLSRASGPTAVRGLLSRTRLPPHPTSRFPRTRSRGYRAARSVRAPDRWQGPPRPRRVLLPSRRG
jgi:hypothetical protein